MRFLGSTLLLFACIPFSWAVDIETADSATVLIIVTDANDEAIGSGSGFFVSDNGHVLTNAHVVNSPKIHKVTLFGKAMPTGGIDASIIWIVSENDVAVLKTTKPLTVKPLKLLSKDISKGDNVWALGYPGKQLRNMTIFGESFEGIDATLTDGIVSRIFEGAGSSTEHIITQIQHTAEISAGNSGGPLLDKCGSVAGINTSVTFDGADNAEDVDFFAIGSSQLLTLLSPRIDGLISVEKCEASESPKPAAPPVGPYSKDIKKPATSDKTEDQVSADKRTQEQPSNTYKSLGWLLTALVSLCLGYYYLRSQRKNSPKPAIDDLNNPAIANNTASPKKLFRISGFNANGSPVSYVFESRSANNERGEIIGRNADFSDFTIANTDISKAHAQVKIMKNICYIRDLGSTNGTSVNGAKLTPFIYTKISYSDEVSIAACTLTITA